MVSKLPKLYSLRPLWFLFYFLLYDLYVSNVSLSSEYAAQFYTHGTVLALWGFTLAAESNLWKVLLPPYLLPLYVGILMLSLTTFAADAFCLYVVFVYRPTYLSVDDINSSGAYATGLIVAIFAISTISIALAFTGFTSANSALSESIFKRPGWVDAIKMFRIAWCIFIMAFGDSLAIAVWIALADIAWIVITYMGDSEHDKRQGDFDKAKQLLSPATAYGATAEISGERSLNIPIIFGNLWIQIVSLIVSLGGTYDVGHDVLVLLCILSLVSTIFDSIGASYIDFEDAMKHSQTIKTKERTLSRPATNEVLNMVPTKWQGFAKKMAKFAPNGTAAFAKRLADQVGLSAIVNKPSKVKLDHPQVSIKSQVAITPSSLTRRKAVAMRF